MPSTSDFSQRKQSVNTASKRSYRIDVDMPFFRRNAFARPYSWRYHIKLDWLTLSVNKGVMAYMYVRDSILTSPTVSIVIIFKSYASIGFYTKK